MQPYIDVCTNTCFKTQWECTDIVSQELVMGEIECCDEKDWSLRLQSIIRRAQPHTDL